MEEGILPTSRMVTLTQEEMVPGSGILTQHFPGTTIPIEGVARLMITYSDNTATNMILEQIGTRPVVETMAKLGYGETRVNSKSFRRDLSIDLARSEKYGLGSTTAADMVSLFEKLYRKELVSVQASEKMLKHLLTCDDRSKLARFLPKSVKIYHKTGAVSNVRTDAGLLELPNGTIAIAVDQQQQGPVLGEENGAEILCGKIGQTAAEYFYPDLNKKKEDTQRWGASHRG